MPATTVATGGTTPRAIERADLNGDGRPDLAVANFDSADISVLFGTAAGGFADQGTWTVGAGAHNIAAGDFDGDDDVDLAVANANDGSISIRINNGNGTFGIGPTITGLFVPYTVDAADLDGDTNVDLVTRGHSTARVLFGNGDGTFDPAVDYAVGSDVRLVELADLDNQGGPDIVTANWASGDVSVLLNDGTGGFASAVSYPAGTNPAFVQAADLDGDNFRDLAVANFGSDNVSVLLNDGDGTFTTGPTQAVGASPEEVRIGDLDGDGVRDLVTGNRADNDISVLLNTVPGVVYDRTDYPATNPRGLALGDTNADGFSDIVATNGSGNSLSVLLNDPPPVLPQASIDDISVTEGNAGTTPATLTVSLDRSPPDPVSIGYATVQGTATAPGDFVEKQGTLNFAPGETSKQISVLVNGDTVDEPDEAFEIHLINPTNATISKAIGQITIVDDDMPAGDPPADPPPAGDAANPGTAVQPQRRTVRVPRLIASCGDKTPKGNAHCEQGPFNFPQVGAIGDFFRKLEARGIATLTKKASGKAATAARTQGQQKALRDKAYGGELMNVNLDLVNPDGSDEDLVQGKKYRMSTDQTVTISYTYFYPAKDKIAIAEEKEALRKQAERLDGTKKDPPKSRCLPISAGESNKQIAARFPKAGATPLSEAINVLAKLGCDVKIGKRVRGKPSIPFSYVKGVTGTNAKEHTINVELAQPGSHDFIFAIREDPSQFLAPQNKNNIPIGTDGHLTVSDTQANRFTVQVIERASGRFVPGIPVEFYGKTQTTDANGETTFTAVLRAQGDYRLSAVYKEMEGWRTIRAENRGSRAFISMAGRKFIRPQKTYGAPDASQLQFAVSLPVVPANLGSGDVRGVESIPRVQQATVTTFDSSGREFTGQHNVVSVPNNSSVLVGAGPGLLALGGGDLAQTGRRLARAGTENPLAFLGAILGSLKKAIDTGVSNVNIALTALNQASIARSANLIGQAGGNLISDKGLGVISTGGGNVISTGGLNLISDKGLGVISTGGGNLIGQAGGNLIGQAGGNVISTGGGNAVPVFGGNVISTGGGN